MLKKLKYLIMASIVILLFSSTTVIADENQGFERNGNTLKYDGETLYIDNFSELISNNNEMVTAQNGNAFRGSFLRVDPGILIGTQLNFLSQQGIIKPPIYNKSVSCIAHDYSNAGYGSPYKITNVIDICYDEGIKSVVIKTYSKKNQKVEEDVVFSKDAKNIAGKLAVAININDHSGTGLSQKDYFDAYNNNPNHIVYGMWTPYKNAIDIYFGKLVGGEYININPLYSQVADLNEKAEELGQKTALEEFKNQYRWGLF